MLGLFVACRLSLVMVCRLHCSISRVKWSTGSLYAWASVVTVCAGSVVAVRGLSLTAAYGIFLDQGLNPCGFNQQVSLYPLHHERSLSRHISITTCLKCIHISPPDEHIYSPQDGSVGRAEGGRGRQTWATPQLCPSLGVGANQQSHF